MEALLRVTETLKSIRVRSSSTRSFESVLKLVIIDAYCPKNDTSNLTPFDIDPY